MIWVGDIDEKFLQAFLEDQYSHKGSLRLCTKGGSIWIMRTVIDLIDRDPNGDTYNRRGMEAIGEVASAGVPIIAAGKIGWRSATQNTFFTVHNPYVMAEAGAMGQAQGKEISAECERALNTYVGLLGRFTKKKAGWWREKLANGQDWTFDAQEAVRLGVIDSIF